MGLASEGVRAHLLSMAKRCVAEPHALHIGCFYCAAVLGFQAALFANKKARFYQNLGRELVGVGGARFQAAFGVRCGGC